MLSSVNGAGITLHSLTFLWIQPDLHRITTHQYEWKRHEWFKNGAKAESVTGAAPPWVVLGAPHRCSNRWQLFCLSLIAHDADKQLTKQCDAKIILHLCKLYCWIDQSRWKQFGRCSLSGWCATERPKYTRPQWKVHTGLRCGADRIILVQVNRAKPHVLDIFAGLSRFRLATFFGNIISHPREQHLRIDQTSFGTTSENVYKYFLSVC